MPADERIKVTFHRVFVRSDADWFGSGDFYFIASVDGQSVGNRRQIFDANEGRWIDLDPMRWSAIVDVSGKQRVEVRFQGMDEDLFFDEDLGTVGRGLRAPWAQRDYSQKTKYFIVEWSVELAIEGAFGRHPPDEVFACRENLGSCICTTVSGTRIVARLECHPVRPVPASVPPRPVFPPGTGAAVNNRGNATIFPSPIAVGDPPLSPLNVISNPSVIPILSPPGGAAPPAGSPPTATPSNVARIECTYYRPDTLAFTDGDPRLEWSVVSVAGGGNARFFGPPQGLKVSVYGTSAGEVRLEVRFRGALMATYRALVIRVRAVVCRFNILNGPNAQSQPSATPAEILLHLEIANRYLYQAGLQLVLDTNVTVKNNAHVTSIPGIFRIGVSKGTTWRIDDAVADLRATRLNYRPGVMNFAYIHSQASRNLGAATDIPPSNLAAAPGVRPAITDTGTPSTSWAIPSGISPDLPAAPQSMQLITPIQRTGHPRLYAMYVTKGHDSATQPIAQVRQNYANTIVHEFLHILNLGHRVEGVPETSPGAGDQRDMTAADAPAALSAGGIFWDGLLQPPGENVMHWVNPGTLAQDIDIIQVRAILQSPLVPP